MANPGLMIPTSPQTPSLREEVGENYHPCTGDARSVEDWINKEFGDMEVSSQIHHETDLIYMAFRTWHVEEFIDMAEFVDAAPSLQEGQAAFFFVPLDEGLFYEPELWSFS